MSLEALFPEARRLTVGGRAVEISPLKMRQVPVFLRSIAKPWALVMAEEYLAAIMEFPDEIRQAVSAATDLEDAFLSDLRADEFLDLAAAVLEVNLDFFARMILPKTNALAKNIQKIGQMTTSSSSPASSPQDTATTTLADIPSRK